MCEGREGDVGAPFACRAAGHDDVRRHENSPRTLMPRIGHPLTKALMEVPLSECSGVCREWAPPYSRSTAAVAVGSSGFSAMTTEIAPIGCARKATGAKPPRTGG